MSKTFNPSPLTRPASLPDLAAEAEKIMSGLICGIEQSYARGASVATDETVALLFSNLKGLCMGISKLKEDMDVRSTDQTGGEEQR